MIALFGPNKMMNARTRGETHHTRPSNARVCLEHILLAQELVVAGICAQWLQLSVDAQMHAVGHPPACTSEPRERGIRFAQLDVNLGDVDTLLVDLRPPFDLP